MTRDPLASLSDKLAHGEPVGQSQDRRKRTAHAGQVTEVLGPGLFRVELPGNIEVVAHLGGAMRMLTPRLIPGDHVEVEVSSYDPSRGRIVRRMDGG